MSFLAPNWGWFLLGTFVFGGIALVFAVKTFVKTAVAAPKAMGQMVSGLEEGLQHPTTDSDEVSTIMSASMKGFTKGGSTFFGTFFKNAIVMVPFSLASVICFVLAVIGLIGWLFVH